MPKAPNSIDRDALGLVEAAAELLAGRKLPVRVAGGKASAARLVQARKELERFGDLAELDSSVLGALYESLLEREDRSGSKQTWRRRSGIFYTPGHITEFLVKAALDACLRPPLIPPQGGGGCLDASDAPPSIPPQGGGRSDAVPPLGETTGGLSILDPACGCGAFLIAAFRELRKRSPDISAKTIATEWLHGVDIDPSAVHVARLSIFIEAGLQRKHWPLLESSIRVGDSLREGIGSNRRYRIIVGNPPYRNVKRGIPDDLKEFLKSNYRTARGQWDLASPFVELALEHLMEPGGAMGFILPNPVLLAENYQPVREMILERGLVAYGPAGRAFPDPGVEASLVVVGGGGSPDGKVWVLDGSRKTGEVKRIRRVPVSMLQKLPFRVFSHLAEPALVEGISRGLESGKLIRLGELVKFTRGIECGKNDARVIAEESQKRGAIPLIVGESVRAYFALPTRSFRPTDPRSREGGIKDRSLWEGERQLLVRRVAQRPIAAVASPASAALNTLYVVRGIGGGVDEYAACAVLNSSAFGEIFRRLYAFDDRLFPYLRMSQLAQTPIPSGAFEDRNLAKWSRELHEIGRECGGAPRGAGARELLRKIDRRVVKMYGVRVWGIPRSYGRKATAASSGES